MVDIKKSIKDYGVQILRELLMGKPPEKGKASLDDISGEDLRKEKVRLDHEEGILLRRVRDLEMQKKQLFMEGVRNDSEREQRVMARQIKEVDSEAANVDRTLEAISKQKRIINGLLQVKERYRFMAESGVSGLLKDIDLGELLAFVDKASIDGEFHMDKFDELINALEESDAVAPGRKEDKDVNDILVQMQKAREAMDNPEAMEKNFEELSANLRKNEEPRQGENPEEDI